jgi:hypothetical protein
MVEDGSGAMWREFLSEIEGNISEPVFKTALQNALSCVSPNRS